MTEQERILTVKELREQEHIRRLSEIYDSEHDGVNYEKRHPEFFDIFRSVGDEMRKKKMEDLNDGRDSIQQG